MGGPFRVIVDRRVEKDLDAAPRHIINRFIASLDALAEDPVRPRPGFDAKPLQGMPYTYRLRIGAWRVLFQVDKVKRVVRVTSAAPRHRAYR